MRAAHLGEVLVIAQSDQLLNRIKCWHGRKGTLLKGFNVTHFDHPLIGGRLGDIAVGIRSRINDKIDINHMQYLATHRCGSQIQYTSSVSRVNRSAKSFHH
jgi:hypothetical protein